MQEKSKKGIIKVKKIKKITKAKTESIEESELVKDQQERGYYYDDSHGYQVYKSEDDSEDE